MRVPDMELYYYHDAKTHALLNAAGLDYTPAYLPVVLKNLGLTAKEIGGEEIAHGVLRPGDVAVFGCDVLGKETVRALKTAEADGVTLVFLGTKAQGLLPEPEPAVDTGDKYALAGYFTFRGSDVKLPVLGSFGTVPGETLGNVRTGEKEYPAFAKTGNCSYCFSFDLVGTLLYCADGRPTPDGTANFPLGRVPDSILLGQDYDFDTPYADVYTGFLRDLIGMPYVFELYENKGGPADLVLYFGGDDDASSRENNMRASDEMVKRGLPYHLNLMPRGDGTFVIDRNDFEELHRRGHETAIHYDFTVYPYTREGFRMQDDAYRAAFGEPSRSPVNHCLVQIGTASERYRLQHEFGARSDNNRFQYKTDPENINAFNRKGFGHGSAFPRFVIDDAAHGNGPIAFCEVYNSYYEPRIYNNGADEQKSISDYIDAGIANGRTLQLFTHPHYISGVFADNAPALRAIDYALEYVRKTGKNVAFSAPGAVGEWWHERASCRIFEVNENGFTVDNPTDRTVYIVLPTGKRAEGAVTKTVSGKERKLVPAQKGKIKVRYL